MTADYRLAGSNVACVGQDDGSRAGTISRVVAGLASEAAMTNVRANLQLSRTAIEVLARALH